jgi:sulfur-oxidizing protein SoxY
MISRRAFLLVGLVAGTARAQLPPNIAEIRQAALQEAIARATGNAQVRRGRVKLEIPPLIDNGNAVPLSVQVDSPMSAADHVKAIHVFTERNPQPYVLTAHLGPRAGKARLATRARIGDT